MAYAFVVEDDIPKEEVFNQEEYYKKVQEMEAYDKRIRSFGMEDMDGLRRLGVGRGITRFGNVNAEDDSIEIEVGRDVKIDLPAAAASAPGKYCGMRPAGGESDIANIAPCKKSVRDPVSSGGGGGGGGSKKKMNGYLLFALSRKKQAERKTENKLEMSMDQVLKTFDEDWRMLTEEEKQNWKDKAKNC